MPFLHWTLKVRNVQEFLGFCWKLRVWCISAQIPQLCVLLVRQVHSAPLDTRPNRIAHTQTNSPLPCNGWVKNWMQLEKRALTIWTLSWWNISKMWNFQSKRSKYGRVTRVRLGRHVTRFPLINAQSRSGWPVLRGRFRVSFAKKDIYRKFFNTFGLKELVMVENIMLHLCTRCTTPFLAKNVKIPLGITELKSSFLGNECRPAANYFATGAHNHCQQCFKFWEGLKILRKTRFFSAVVKFLLELCSSLLWFYFCTRMMNIYIIR